VRTSAAPRRQLGFARWLMIAVSSALAGLLLAVGVFHYAAAKAPQYREDVEALLSETSGAPASLGELQLRMHGFNPRLLLRDVRLDAESGDTAPLHFSELRLDFSLMRLLRGDFMPAVVEVAGLTLDVTRDIDGNWRVGALGGEAAGEADLDAMLRRLSGFQRIVISQLDLRLMPEGEADFLPIFVERLWLDRQSAGWSVGALAGFADVPLRAELNGQVRGVTARPETWRHEWQLQLQGDVPARPAYNALLPHWPGEVAMERLDLRLQAAFGPDEALSGQFSALLARARAPNAPTLRDVELRGEWSPRADGWALRLDHIGLSSDQGAWPSSSARLIWQEDDELSASRIRADAGFLRLDELAPWLLAAGVWPESAPLWELRGEARGIVLRASLDPGIQRLDYRALLDGIALQGEAFSIEGLSGELSGDYAGGQLRISPGALTVETPGALNVPLVFSEVEGSVRWAREAEGWKLKSDAFAWSMEGISGEGELSLALRAGAAPHIDMNMRFAGEDVEIAKDYMPRAWTGPLRAWLNRAIEAGRVPEASLTLRGDLSAFPWDDEADDGLFALDIRAVGGRLTFAPAWPAITDVAADLRFRGNSLRIEVESGRVAGGRIRRGVAEIPRYADAMLKVDAEVDGNLEGYYRYLSASPLAQRLRALLQATAASGPAPLSLQLDIPLSGLSDVRARGVVDMQSVSMRVHALDDVLTDVSGLVSFENQRISAESLSAEFRGVPLRARILPMTDAPSELRVDTAFDADAGNGVATLVPEWIRRHIGGRTPIRLGLTLGDGAEDGVWVESTMEGLDIDLPAPLDITPSAQTPLRIVLRGDTLEPEAGDASGIAIDIRLGDRLHVAGRDDVWRVHLGSGTAPQVHSAGVHLSGAADTVDLRRWMDMGGNGLTDAAAGLSRARVHAGHLRFGQAEIRNVMISLDADGSTYRGQLSGGISGEFAYYARFPGHLEARFDALSVHGDIAETLAQQREAPVQRVDASPADPATIPTVDLLANAVQFNGLDFGSLDLRTQRIANGIRLEHLRIGGGAVYGEVEGEWLVDQPDVADATHTPGLSLRFGLASEQPSAVLDALGYAGNVRARQLQTQGALHWPSIGRGVALSTATGSLRVESSDGTLEAVEPGAGRMLGLLNFYAVPRRLALNFRDVLGEGLAFDRLSGEFRLEDGNAYTDDLRIVGPSLRVEVAGRVGLAARDYDQRIRVIPDVSGGVTLGAILLGGPAAGLLALMVRELIEKPLDQVTQFSYRLTGTWDNPQVTPGDVVPAEAP
jgi:uncharacterized protein (TIGR02099 family)